MVGNLAETLAAWTGEEVIIRHDPETSAWVVIAIHSSRLGPATGGTRMKSYVDLAAAVADATQLAEAMTYKFALASLPRGGGKCVIATPPGLSLENRHELLLRYGALLAQLQGLFWAGPDIGTSSADMDIIAETGAPYVFSRTAQGGGAGDSAMPTALGVLSGIQAACRHVFDSACVRGRTIAVQGVGGVGAELAGMLVKRGARVLASDVAKAALEKLDQKVAVETVPADEVYDVPCDAFAPCAIGGVLNEKTIPRLRCRIVAGSANNQLEEESGAGELRKRGILYAPDFVISLGGAMAITGIESIGWTREEAERRIQETIAGTLSLAFALADRREITTVEAAKQVAAERLAEADRG